MLRLLFCRYWTTPQVTSQSSRQFGSVRSWRIFLLKTLNRERGGILSKIRLSALSKNQSLVWNLLEEVPLQRWTTRSNDFARRLILDSGAFPQMIGTIKLIKDHEETTTTIITPPLQICPSYVRTGSRFHLSFCTNLKAHYLSYPQGQLMSVKKSHLSKRL